MRSIKYAVITFLLLVAAIAYAADTRITDLSELTLGNVAPGDWVECVDTSDTTDNAAGSSRKCKVSSMMEARYKLGGDFTSASVTNTEVTGIGPMTVAAAGTYSVKCTLAVQSVATSTSPQFAMNYTGTATLYAATVMFPSAGVSAATGQVEGSVNATTGSIIAYSNSVTEATTSPTMGPWTGFVTTGENALIMIEALFVVSDTGDIELWAGSEVNTSTITIKAGSFCTMTTL